MIKFISLSLGTALLLGLGGCASYALVPTELIVDFDNSKADTLYFMKNSPGFENSESEKKFSKIKSLTERFQSTTTCTRVEQRNGTCRFHILNEYYELKDKDAGEDKTQTILYGASDRERVKINDYVNWLKSNYGLTNLKAGS